MVICSPCSPKSADSEESFEPSNYETAGPEFEGIAEEDRTIDASDQPSAVLSGLENDITYYVSVRTHDESGMESDLSNVISATPKPTFSISEQLNEEGGLEGCSSVPDRNNPLYLGAPLSLLLLFRREQK